MEQKQLLWLLRGVFCFASRRILFGCWIVAHSTWFCGNSPAGLIFCCRDVAVLWGQRWRFQCWKQKHASWQSCDVHTRCRSKLGWTSDLLYMSLRAVRGLAPVKLYRCFFHLWMEVLFLANVMLNVIWESVFLKQPIDLPSLKTWGKLSWRSLGASPEIGAAAASEGQGSTGEAGGGFLLHLGNVGVGNMTLDAELIQERRLLARHMLPAAWAVLWKKPSFNWSLRNSRSCCSENVPWLLLIARAR